MDEQQDQVVGVTNARLPGWAKTLLIALGVFVGLIVVATFFGSGSDRDIRQQHNEASAILRLQLVNRLEHVYMAESPDAAFTCDLRELMPGRPEAGRNDDVFFSTGQSTGYSFSFVNCRPDQDGVVRRYQIVAVPIEPGRSGQRAYCGDETGAIWFDTHNSAERCLQNRIPEP